YSMASLVRRMWIYSLMAHMAMYGMARIMPFAETTGKSAKRFGFCRIWVLTITPGMGACIAEISINFY
ncbi:MAG: hypothetical protein ACREUI_09965, partial [Burkholderiales bacterium]